ncbi:hypothetical protein HYW75_06130 [Candidatus Pacearchaeota archaeon]|nr:hypothetical protein [Candidatus Pacearchaeota archaeon]
MNKKGLSKINITITIIVILVVIGILFFINKNSKQESLEVLIPTSELSNCLFDIDNSKLPNSIGDYTGTSVKLTEPFKWEGPDNVKRVMQIDGYLNVYSIKTLSRESKSIQAAIMKFREKSDYEKLASDLKSTKERDTGGLIKEGDAKGAITYIFDYADQNQVIWYVIAGNQIYAQFEFVGSTFDESKDWINDWTSSIC